MNRLPIAAFFVLIVAMTLRIGLAAIQQTPPQTPPAAPAQAPASKPGEPDEGIPITNQMVKSVCGACHKTDEKGRMSRISYRRTTPEGWQETIRRMVTLNKVEMQPAEAREIVRYLSDTVGLAPEEVKPGLFEVERRLIDYKYAANSDTETHLLALSLDGPRHSAAPHRGRVERPHRDAPGLLPARRLPGLPPVGSSLARART